MGKAPTTKRPPRKPRPRDAAFGKPQVQLSVVVPADIASRLRRDAEAQGSTLRIIVLRALKAIGYPIQDSDIADRRAEAGKRRSEIYRRGKGGQP